MKKVMIFIFAFLLFITLSSNAQVMNCETSAGYEQTVDGNINHFQSTGCTPYRQPYDCTVVVEFR